MSANGTTVHDLWRLAHLAEERGVRILREAASGEHYATSASDDTLVYRVTGFSCTCKGFVRHQRCTHHSALLAFLGWLPDPESPAPLAPALAEPTYARCPLCLGSRTNWVAGPDGEQMGVTCVVCGGSAEVEERADEPTDRDDDRDGSGGAIVALPSVQHRADLRECRDCQGTGTRRIHLGGTLSNWVSEVCRRCDATGWERSEAA